MGSGPKVYRVLQVSDKCAVAKPGDRVLCYSYTEGAIKVEDDKKIIGEDQILAIL
jgi:co-chaperonin GroES (HSP10)